MDDIFFLKLALSFIVGGAWITLATVLAEKFGTKLGGVIAGLPSTTAIALFFIAWSQTPFFASEATTIMPVVMGINSLFVLVYSRLTRYSFWFSLITALGIWFALSFGLVLIEFDNFILALVIFTVVLAFSYFILEKKSGITSVGKKDMTYTGWQLMSRGIFSGTMIALAVLMGKVSGPLWGGIFSIFPAVYVSIIYITHLAHGKSFSLATLKTAMISGQVGVCIYVVTARYTYLYLDLFWGTFSPYLATLTCTLVLYYYINKKVS
ncbi:MAG: DUF3147 family protein [Dehalococcoidales bacterium]|jgi:hypothetical protein|nr:DUF3147 family protein [Dehalococcoidales bacterium]MDP7415399.1 DUF3147 family protein [Dehalococcoidales bacterium]|tara:strand:+ start:171 stop:968 length:798 start_codon:yes stop_codon:yes gene_type:complete